MFIAKMILTITTKTLKTAVNEHLHKLVQASKSHDYIILTSILGMSSLWVAVASIFIA